MKSDQPVQGNVYWFDPEPVKGSEIRPCIVVSPDEMNQRLRTIIVVPITSAVQPWPFRATFHLLGQTSSAACDQLRSVDKSRLRARIGELKPSDKDKVFGVLQTLFAL